MHCTKGCTLCTDNESSMSTGTDGRILYTSTPGRILYKTAKQEKRSKTASGCSDEKVDSSVLAIYDKPTSGVIGGKMDMGLFAKKPESTKVNMFLRAQNREFYGMTEADESKWQGNYEFICLGDPQIGMGDQKKEEEFSRQTVEFINKRKDRIKFVVVCGDHTHNLEDMWSKGDLEGGQKKRLQELASYKQIYSKLDVNIPLVCVCGNHDVGNRPSKKTVQLYKEEFGDDYLAFWCGGVKFIVLNSQIVQGLDQADELSVAHEKWLDEELARKHRNRPVHLVAMCHIPPFCWDVQENDTNFNWPKGKREMWLDKMVDAKVKKVYCSHYHRRAGGKYKTLEVMVSGALGTYIRTKPTPKEFQRSKLDEINFKLSYQGFGGTETSEDTSGLQVVTVTREGLAEKWLSIGEIIKEINQAE